MNPAPIAGKKYKFCRDENIREFVGLALDYAQRKFFIFREHDGGLFVLEKDVYYSENFIVEEVK